MTPPEAAAPHPGPAAIRQLVSGKATAAEARVVVRHLLAGCARCRQLARDARDGRDDPGAWSYDEVFARLRRRLADNRLDLAPLAPAAAAIAPGAHELFAELLAHDAVEALMQVQSTRRYAYLALCELLLRKSLATADPAIAAPAASPAAEARPPRPAAAEPGAAGSGAGAHCAAAAAEVAELLDLEIYGAPVVQDARGIAWVYFADPRRMQEDLRTAEVSLGIADRLLAGGPGGAAASADLLTVQAALAGHCGGFGEALRLLNGAATVHRRAGRRHLLGRTLLKKGIACGNAGEPERAVRLLLRGIDCVEPAREPRLVVWATHNLAWFLHEAGRTGQAAACIDAARRLYQTARDRRELSRLRWLEGKLAGDFATAESALGEARDGLEREGLSYEAALATMDLAVRYAGERQGERMRRQADAMLPLFRAGDMHGDTAQALQSFQRHGEGADPAPLLRDLGAYLQQTRRPQNPPALAAAFPS